MITPGFSSSEQDWCIPATLDLVRELASRHDVHVFALRYPERRAHYRVYGAAVTALGGAGAAGLTRLPLFARTIAALAAQHRRRRLDLLQAFFADEPGFLAVAGGRLLGVPAIVSLRAGELAALPDLPYGGLLTRGRWLTRWALRGAHRVTVGSRYLARMAAPHVPPGRLSLAPLGVDTSLFRPLPPPDPSPLGAGEFRLLCVASLGPVKDHGMLLRAMARVLAQAPGVHLHLVGGGGLRPALEAEACSRGIRSSVSFHGSVRHELLPAYYSAADLCVLASRHESQGMVVLEAAACGRATVGTAVGILPELMPPSCVVPVGDDAALAAALLELVRDPDARAAAGRAALERVRAGYTLEQRVPKLESLYASVCEKAPSAG